MAIQANIIPAALVYSGFPIRDRGEMLSLTDMWRASGSDDSKRPYEWSRKEGAAFIEAVALAHNTPVERIYSAARGKGGATFAHWQIGIAYAKYLSHDFHMWCNTIVRQHMEGGSRPAAVSDLSAEVRAVIGGIVKGVVHREIGDMLGDLIPALVRAEISERNLIVRSGKTAKEIWDAHGLTPKLRGATVWFGNRLAEMGCLSGGGLRADRGNGAIRLFDPDKAAICLRNGLLHRSKVYASERMGQGRFKLIQD